MNFCFSYERSVTVAGSAPRGWLMFLFSKRARADRKEKRRQLISLPLGEISAVSRATRPSEPIRRTSLPSNTPSATRCGSFLAPAAYLEYVTYCCRGRPSGAVTGPVRTPEFEDVTISHFFFDIPFMQFRRH